MTANDCTMRWLPRGIVVATGIAFGVFIWHTYFAPVPHLYPLEFQHAQWLVASDGEPQGYFRKEIYISGRIQQAWIKVAATDSFILYVNGKAVGGIGYASMRVSEIYDIGPYLFPGKNVVGVAARRISYPGPAQAVLEAAYRDQADCEHRLATDASWQFSPVEQTQGNGEIPWYSAGFDATAWATARAADRPIPSEIYPLGIHPLAFAMPPQGKWIGYSSSPEDRPTFSSTLTLPARPEDGWLRIAAAQSYALSINGVPLRGEPFRTLPPMGVDGASVWRTDGRLSTDIYNIRALLRAGPNHIMVSSEQGPFLDGLFVDGFVSHNGELLTFGTDAHWTISVAPSTTHGPALPRPQATVLANNDSLPIKNAMRTILPSNYEVTQAGKMAFVVLVSVGAVYLLWGATSHLSSRLPGVSATTSSSVDALVHLPILLALGALYFLSYDVRFDPAFPFQPYIVGLAIALLLVLKSLVLLEMLLRRGHVSRSLSNGPAWKTLTGTFVYGFLFFCLIASGAYLRLHDLDAQSLYHDEVHMVGYVQGLFEKGYPYKMIGPIERPLATYELVPYPIALSAKFLGFSEFALRLPAALFGIMTIALIGFVGAQLFDRRVGLLAAAIFAFCPQALIWAKYLWHPQQTQFFALLTSYLFFQGIRGDVLVPKYLYLAAIACCVTYLSWEGSGFFLPALGLALIVVKGKNFAWFRDHHLWMAVGIISVVVVLQLIRRTLLQIPYLVVGQGLSDVSLPTLFFLDPMYDSTFYLHNFLWLENNIPLTVLAFGGLLFFFRQRTFVYYCILLLSVLIMMTTLLTNAAIRYMYYLQPFLILSSSASLLFLLDKLHSCLLCLNFLVPRLIFRSFSIVLPVFIIIASSSHLKAYRLTDFNNAGGFHIKSNVYYIDYHSSSQFLRTSYNSGDLVISVVPNALKYYSNIDSDYFFQFYTFRQVVYDPTETFSHYLERTIGIPAITTIQDLRYVLSMNKKVWIVAAPYRIFVKLFGHEAREYINKNGIVVHESYNTKIYIISH